MRCPNCNAVNPESAEWCALCLRRFEPDPPPPIEATAVVRPYAAPQPSGSPISEASVGVTELHDSEPIRQSGPVTRRGDLVTWTCQSCSNENAMTSERCAVCGTSFYAAFGPIRAKEPGITGNPVAAALLSVIPGAGHLYLKRTGEGIVRLSLGVWWFLIALFLPNATRSLIGVKALYALAALGLVGVSMIETYQAAENPSSSQILTRSMVLWTSIGLFGLLMIGGIASAFSAT